MQLIGNLYNIIIEYIKTENIMLYPEILLSHYIFKHFKSTIVHFPYILDDKRKYNYNISKE